MRRIRLPACYLRNRPSRTALSPHYSPPLFQPGLPIDCQLSNPTYPTLAFGRLSLGVFLPSQRHDDTPEIYGYPKPLSKATSCPPRRHGEPVVGLEQCIALGATRVRFLHTCEMEGISKQGLIVETDQSLPNSAQSDSHLATIDHLGNGEIDWESRTDSPLMQISILGQTDLTDTISETELDLKYHSRFAEAEEIETGGATEDSAGFSGAEVESSNSPEVIYDEELYSEPTSSEDMSDLSEFEIEKAEISVEESQDWKWLDSTSEESKEGFDMIAKEYPKSEDFSEEDFTHDSSEDYFLTVGNVQNGSPYLHGLSVDEVTEILEKTRAKDVKVLDVQESCEWVDQLIFASGRSSRHLRGMADAIVHKVKQCSRNVGPNSFPLVEGREGEQWMVIDCGNIAVHLFLEEARSYYDLEEFWRKKTNPRLRETF